MRKSGRKKNRDEQKEIAAERIEILFALADAAALSKDLECADRRIAQAKKIAMKYNLRTPRELRRKACKYCEGYLLPGVTSRVRVKSADLRVEVRCLRCDKVMYYPYAREKQRGRKNEGKIEDTADR
jgi:ribonuclease P protein subunit RPR2